MTVDHVKELEKIQALLGGNTVESISTIDGWLEWGSKLSQWLAYSGQCMSTSKKELLDARARFYESFVFNMKARGLDWIPASAINKYVEAKCSSEQYKYDLSERVNRSTVHMLDFVRTAISSLKQESFYMRQPSRQQ